MDAREIRAQAPWCEKSLLRSVLSRLLGQELDLWLKTMVSRGLSDDHMRDELRDRTGVDVKAVTLGAWRRQLGYVLAPGQSGARVKAADRSRPRGPGRG